VDILSQYLSAKRDLINQALDQCLPPATAEPRIIHECMRYSVQDGKRLRPTIVLAVAETLACPVERALPTAVAVELIHTHSLILDDLPGMDNDDCRRGRPATHDRFGEGIALLAADALLNLAIVLLGANHRLIGLPAETALDIIREVGENVGTNGMIGGQVADLTFSPAVDGASMLERIHLRKTANLFRLSARAASLVAGATEHQLAALSSYAENLGLAYQIIDDILDHAKSGNPIKGRPRAGPNFATAYGIPRAHALAEQLTREALRALSGFDATAETLRSLAKANLLRPA